MSLLTEAECPISVISTPREAAARIQSAPEPLPGIVDTRRNIIRDIKATLETGMQAVVDKSVNLPNQVAERMDATDNEGPSEHVLFDFGKGRIVNPHYNERGVPVDFGTRGTPIFLHPDKTYRINPPGLTKQAENPTTVSRLPQPDSRTSQLHGLRPPTRSPLSEGVRPPTRVR